MNEIYDEYFYKIYNWSLKKTHCKEDAEDLTNNIFLAIFEYLNKNIEIEKLNNLIWKIAKNMWCTKAKEYIKDKNNIYNLENLNIGKDEISIDKIIYKEIIDSIDDYKLTKNEKTCFKFYYLNDLSIKEISTKTNISANNIKYYLYNARKKIKEMYYE